MFQSTMIRNQHLFRRGKGPADKNEEKKLIKLSSFKLLLIIVLKCNFFIY